MPSESHIPSNTTAPSLAKGDYVVLEVLVYATTLWRRKWIPILWAVSLFCLAIAYSYTQPKLYESTLRFLPPVRSSASLPFSFSRVSESDQSRSLLTSTTVLSDVVQRLRLQEYFKAKDLSQAVGMLRGTAQFSVDANNFVTINVRTKEPNTSAQIANELYAALSRLNEKLSRHEAEHRLEFMSGPMEIERERLSAAEDALRNAQEKTGLIVPNTQASIGLQALASVRQRISDLQAQLAVERVSQTDESPSVVGLRSRISNLQGQVASLESKSTQADSPARLPELSLEVQRREREVQMHTLAMDSLARAMQVSQLQDSYTPSLSLIDPATPNKQKVAPSRKLYALAGSMLGLVLGVLYVLGSALVGRWKISPRVLALKVEKTQILRGVDLGDS